MIVAMTLQGPAQTPFTPACCLSILVGSDVSPPPLLWYVLFMLVWDGVVSYFCHVHSMSINMY